MVGTEDYPGWSCLREIDQALDLPKGSAFRAFKQFEPALAPGTDFVLLRPDEAHNVIADLRAQGRIYAGSVNVVLLAPALARRIRDALLAPR